MTFLHYLNQSIPRPIHLRLRRQPRHLLPIPSRMERRSTAVLIHRHPIYRPTTILPPTTALTTSIVITTTNTTHRTIESSQHEPLLPNDTVESSQNSAAVVTDEACITSWLILLLEYSSCIRPPPVDGVDPPHSPTSFVTESLPVLPSGTGGEGSGGY